MSIAPSDRARALVEALHTPVSNEDRWEIVQKHLSEAEALAGRALIEQAINLVRTSAPGRRLDRQKLEEKLRDLMLRPCLCPGCPRKVPADWASGMCSPCLNEDCEHDEPAAEPFSITIDDEED